MTPVRHNVPIESWEEGDQVSGFALVTRKEVRADRNGRTYVDLDVADATGSVSAKIWPNSKAMDSEFASPGLVAFQGNVVRFNERLQLNLDECRQATEADREAGLDEDRLIPSTPEDMDELWRRLQEILREEVSSPPLRRLAEEALARHGEELRVHPAAKSIHHAYRGGLLEHVVAMAELALTVGNRYPQVDRDLLLLGVLFHDLGKLEEIGAMPANDYTLRGQMVGHVVLGRDMLRECCAAVPDLSDEVAIQLEHLVLSHQGRLEFGAPVVPLTSTALALHFIDDLDAKLNQLRSAGTEGPGFRYLRGLGRYVYIEEA